MANTQRGGGTTEADLSASYAVGSLSPRGTGLRRRATDTDRVWLSTESADGAASLHLSPGDLVPGTKYRVVRRLGTGGMGVVYEAKHINTERKAAIKILRRDVGSDPVAVDLFRQEARVASQIGSEYIVQALDFGELPDGRLMYAMELVDGDPVDLELVDGPLSPARTIAILRQVARGLAAAHDAGVIHRDIKPENIMLEREGDRSDHVRLLDFGVSSIASTVRKASDELVGTPYYLPPEVILGQESGPRVDQYSLGCAAYEMLCGEPPFRGPQVGDVLRAHCFEEPPPLKDVPEPIAAVITRCLQKDPNARYADMRDFEAALLEAQVLCGIVTEWDHLPPPTVDPDRRAAIVDAMSDVAPQQPPRWIPYVIVGAVLAALVTVVLIVSGEPEPAAAIASSDVPPPPAVDKEQRALDEGTAAARLAASEGRFVYPPLSAPRAPTAYGEILKLEARGTPEASARAVELRMEFAGQLSGIANHYWAENPEMGLVAEAYAGVLMFNPDDLIALRRSGLVDDEVDKLETEIASGALSDERRLEVEALSILFEPDSERRRERIDAYRAAVEALPTPPKYQAEFDALLVMRSPFAGEAEPDEAEPEPAQSGTTPPATATDKGPKSDPAAAAERSATETKREANRLVEQGQGHLRHGRPGEAQKVFEAAIALHPRLSAGHDGLAQVYFGRSNFRKAATHGQKAVSLSPGNLDYRIHLGDALYRLERYADALVHYQKAAKGGREEAKRRVDKTRAKL